MPAPVKWSAADFELINAESPEGEPWLAASPDGRFNLTFFESFAGPYTDIETRLYSATGLDTGLGPAPTFSAATTDHQGAVAYFPDGRSVYVWTEEPNAGGGNLEDVYASVYVGQLAIVPRFLVAGGAGIQHDPVVAASASGFVVALADDSVAGGQLILKFYNAVGGLITTVSDTDGPEGVNTPPGSEDVYRDVEITALANGNYVVTWTDDANFDIWARIYSPTGVAQTGLIEIEPGGGIATFPDVTALADGRFLVTYEQYAINTVRGRIYEANGTPSADPFTISTIADGSVFQQVQSAALNDGRFVTVYLNTAGNIEGQVMFADGTPDGAAFAVNGDGAGDKSRPTIATLADGRFAVSWESGGTTIFTTIFDPREAGLHAAASGLNDDWIGTVFADEIFGAAGNDRIAGAGGNDVLRGEAGNDTLIGDAGADTLNGGSGVDTMQGGDDNDAYIVDNSGDVTTEASALGGIDIVQSSVTRTLGANLENLTLTGSSIINGTGNTLANTITGNIGANTLSGDSGADTLDGGNGADKLNGGNGADTLIGGTGADKLFGGTGLDTLTGGIGNDTFVFNTAPGAANLDAITDYNVAADTIQLDNAVFAGLGPLGALAAGKFRIGAAALDATDRIIYQAASGRLYFDADGSGAIAPIQIATLDAGLALTAADFVVI